MELISRDRSGVQVVLLCLSCKVNNKKALANTLALCKALSQVILFWKCKPSLGKEKGSVRNGTQVER